MQVWKYEMFKYKSPNINKSINSLTLHTDK